ncbi:MAG: hypothetical protein KDA65_13030, partial [Planctomycetaceae bacterium]|nr:hypothetical protein [Planctomycetaceae bacterium]
APPQNMKSIPSDQYYYALNQEDEDKAEEALRALINDPAHFQGQESEYRKYLKLAQLRLAHLYLTKGLYEEALLLFRDVKDSTEKNDVFNSQSRAGEIIANSLKGDFEQVNRLQEIYDLPNLLKQLSSEEIDLITTSLEKTGLALNEKTRSIYKDRYPTLNLIFE